MIMNAKTWSKAIQFLVISLLAHKKEEIIGLQLNKSVRLRKKKKISVWFGLKSFEMRDKEFISGLRS